MAGKRTVPVRICGQEYRIRSDADPDAVRRAAALVDETMVKIRDRTATVDTLHVAVLAALNIANHLVALREEGERAQPSIDPARLSELVVLLESAVAEPLPTAH